MTTSWPTMVKLSGAGNTFVVLRWDSDFVRILDSFSLSKADLARRICDRERGLSVDGVLYLAEDEGDSDFIWDFFNSDGSNAEMCGNAARCAGRYVHDGLGWSHDRRIKFSTVAGPVEVWREVSGLYTAQMTAVRSLQEEIVLTVDSNRYGGFWLDTGVPHLVIRVSSLHELPASICRQLRFHADLGPAGANITLVKEEGPTAATAVTYERGVEDFTAACGTGAVAAAWAVAGKEGRSKARIKMPGGDLDIDFSATRPTLTGPAKIFGIYQPTTEFFE